VLVNLTNNASDCFKEFLYVLKVSKHIFINRWKQLGKILIIPILIYGVAEIFALQWFQFVLSVTSDIDVTMASTFTVILWSIIRSLLSQLPLLIAGLLLAVNTHRAIILKTGLSLKQPWLAILITFAWRSFILLLIAALFAIPLATISIPSSLEETNGTSNVAAFFTFAVILVIAIHVVSRVSLVLPAAAIGQPSSLGRAWSMTKGRGCLLVLVVLCPWIISFLVGLLSSIVIPDALMSPIYHSLGIVVFILEVVFLSVSYTLLSRQK